MTITIFPGNEIINGVTIAVKVERKQLKRTVLFYLLTAHAINGHKQFISHLINITIK